MYNDISEECYGLATKISHWVATALQGLHIVLHEVSTSCDTQIDASDMFYLTIAAPRLLREINVIHTKAIYKLNN